MPRSKFHNPKAKRPARKFSKIPQFWSFSRWEIFHDCPWRYALQCIAKVQTPPPPQHVFEHGNTVHLKSEHFLLGDIRGVPSDLSNFAGEYRAIKKLGAVPEVDYTVNDKWEPCASDDFDNAWLRAKLDIEIATDENFTIVDVKTGRPRAVHEFQAEIYGMLALERHGEEYEEIDFEFWFTDSGSVEAFTFHFGQLDDLKKLWLKRIKPMLGGRLFKKTPSVHSCRYCPYRSDKVLANGEPGECDAWKTAG